MKELTCAIENNPTIQAAYAWRGDAHLMLTKVREAIDDYSQAIRLDPQDAHGSVQRGVAFDHAGDHAASLAD